jgi:LmbE family N-acetylglucosaminyl deacetylase
VTGPAETRRIRRREAQAAAKLLRARWHPSLVEDAEIFYEDSLLRRTAAVIREVAPNLILTHSPQDYMEDHMNASRVAVTAAFVRGMPNYRTVPRRRPIADEVTIYHAMPHGLRDGLRRVIVPGAFVNTTAVHAEKRAALGAHESQKHWLDVTQGMESYLNAMDAMSRAVGRMSRKFRHAEGWRRHSHLGFSSAEVDPLRDALGDNYRTDRAYERALATGAAP